MNDEFAVTVNYDVLRIYSIGYGRNWSLSPSPFRD